VLQCVAEKSLPYQLRVWVYVRPRFTLYGRTYMIRGIVRYTLQHTATHCNTLHHTAPHCNTPHHTTDLRNQALETHFCARVRKRHLRRVLIVRGGMLPRAARGAFSQRGMQDVREVDRVSERCLQYHLERCIG